MAKPDRIDTLNKIMLTATSGLSIKQIMAKAKQKTGKVFSERYVRKYLKDLKDEGDLRVLVQEGDVELYTVLVARPPDQVLTPAGIVPAASLPTHRPIRFGRPSSNVPASETPEPAPKQVAGSRAAQAFIDSLK